MGFPVLRGLDQRELPQRSVSVRQHRRRTAVSRFAYLQDMLSSLVERYVDSAAREDDRSTQELCDALLSGRGELSGTQMAQSLLQRIDAKEGDALTAFF